MMKITRASVLAIAFPTLMGFADGDMDRDAGLSIPRMEDAVRAAEPHYVRIDFNDLQSGRLEGQAGGIGFAEGSTWDSGSSVIRVTDGDLTPPVPESTVYVPSQTGTPRLLRGRHGQPRQQSRALAVPMDGTVWFGFLARPQPAPGAAGIGFNQRQSWSVRPGILVAGRNLIIQYPEAGRESVVSNVFRPGTEALVIGRIAINAGPAGEDHISVWVDPDVRDPGDPLIHLTTSDFVGDAISRLCLISHGGPDNAAGGELDEVILSNHPHPAAYHHVTPRPRFTGPWHVPIRAASEQTPLPPEGYELVWSDEFDGDALDEDKWEYRLKEKAYSSQMAENVDVSDGALILHLRKEPGAREGYDYTGGGVHSKATFVYGYYEARFKVPSAEGWHTAFWIYPVSTAKRRGAEIDFCEQDSGDPYFYSLGGTDKRFPRWPDKSIGRWVIEDAPNMAENFVVISGEFTPDHLRFYLNGRLAMEMDSGIFPHAPMDVRLTAIATRKKGDRFQDDARLPNRAVFDYVRVYQHPKYRDAEIAARNDPPLRIDRLRPDDRPAVEAVRKIYPPLMIDGLRAD